MGKRWEAVSDSRLLKEPKRGTKRRKHPKGAVTRAFEGCEGRLRAGMRAVEAPTD